MASIPKYMQFSKSQLEHYIELAESFQQVLEEMGYTYPKNQKTIEAVKNYCYKNLGIPVKEMPDLSPQNEIKCPCCNQIKQKTEFYFSGGKLAQRLCKACVREKEKQRYKNHKQELNNYKIEHSCAKCGCNKFYVIDFHHIDPSIKDFTIASNPRKSMKSLIKELEKCIPLCSNCHREFHYLEREKNITIQEYLEAYPSGDGDSLLNCQAE